jgi:hypothetical protein
VLEYVPGPVAQDLAPLDDAGLHREVSHRLSD